MLPNIFVVREGRRRLFLMVVVKVFFKAFPARYIEKNWCMITMTKTL